MASYSKLRQPLRSAFAECVCVLRRHPLATAAALVVVALAAFVALPELAALQGNHAASQHATPAFLTRALGAETPSAPLVRTPAPHVKVTIRNGGLSVADPAGSVGLVSATASASGWREHAGGAVRKSSVGTEAILFDPKGQGAESFLVVDRHQGKRTWRWRLDTTFTP